MFTCKECFYFHLDKKREIDPAMAYQIDSKFNSLFWGRCYCYPPSPNCGTLGILQRPPVRVDEPVCYRFWSTENTDADDNRNDL